MTEPVPVIEVAGLTRAFPGPPETIALRDVSVTIGAGEYVSIVGPSGSGKSTLLNILGLLDTPTLGAYRLAGVDTGPLARKERARLRATTIGFVFQAFHLLPHLSVLENVNLGMLYSGCPRAERQDRARDALASVGLARRAGSSPRTLSGGERQRVAIARAVAQRPQLLLADEPTGNLDGATTRDILAVFSGLNASGLTLVVITHDPQVASHAHSQYAIVDGRLHPGARP